MIIEKRIFNNGLFDCMEIYDDKFKILETTNNQLWNTSEENPIVIAKSRRYDYISSNIEVENVSRETFEENSDNID